MLSGQIISVSVPTLSFTQTTTLESRTEVMVLVKVEETRTQRLVWTQTSKGMSEVLRDDRPAIQPHPAEPGPGTSRPFHRRGFGVPLSASVGIGAADKPPDRPASDNTDTTIK